MHMDKQFERINIGSQVELILRNREGQEERLKVIIVSAEAADFSQGYLGVNTPLAQALIGEKAGTTIPYLKDDIYAIEIVAVAKAAITPPQDAANKREEALQKARREVEKTNLIVFASSFSGKWGDYDPDSIPKDDQTDDKK